MSDPFDFGPEELPRYEALVAELTAKESWKDIERATRAMLRALVLAGKQADEAPLWRRLRTLYDERLSDPNGALLAAEHLERFTFMNPDDQLVLARLYGAAGSAHKAGGVYERVIANDPTNVAAVRALVASRMPKNPDWAWAALSLLAYAGALTESERAFYEARKPSRLPTGRLTTTEWPSIEPPSADKAVDHLFLGLAAAIFEVAKKHPFPPPGADPRFLPHALASPLFPAAFACALRTLGLPPQPHFAEPEAAPSVGEPAELGPVVDDALRELLFIAGRQAAFHRPWHLVLYAFPSVRELTALVWAGRLIVKPDAEVPSALRSFVTGLAIDLQAPMTTREKKALGIAYGRFAETPIDIKRWRDAQDLTAARFGLLLCGDLAIAKKVLDAEQRPPDALSPDEVMKDLCGFAAHGMYALYREKIGLAADTDVVLH